MPFLMRRSVQMKFVYLGGIMNLSEFFRENPKAAVAFSGGVDSAYLLYAAKAAGADVRAYYRLNGLGPCNPSGVTQKLKE